MQLMNMIYKSMFKFVDLGLNASHNFLLSGKNEEVVRKLLVVNNSLEEEEISIWIHQLRMIFEKIGHNVSFAIDLINRNCVEVGWSHIVAQHCRSRQQKKLDRSW